MKKQIATAIMAGLVITSPALAVSGSVKPKPLITKPIYTAVNAQSITDVRRFNCEKQEEQRPEKVFGQADLCWWWSIKPFRRWLH